MALASRHHGSRAGRQPLPHRLVERVPVQRPRRKPGPRRSGDQTERLPHPVALLDDGLRRSRPTNDFSPASSSGTSAAVKIRASARGTTYGTPRNELT